MAIRKIPTTYQASDGAEFSSKLEAERHEKLIEATRALESALAQFNVALGQTQLMGDGTPFTCQWGVYWYLTDPIWHAPELVELRLSTDLNPQFEKTDDCKMRIGVKQLAKQFEHVAETRAKILKRWPDEA